MAYYAELSGIVDNIIGEKILRNQNICKLLAYYPTCADDDIKNIPDLNYSVYSQDDISDTSYLYFENIYPLPKIPAVTDKQETYILVNLSGGYDVDINTGFRKINLVIDIISHLKCWKVKEGFRPYLIMYEIDKMLNNQLTDLPIENKPYSRGFQPKDYNNYFYGVQMIYEFNINSNVDCSPYPKNINIDKSDDLLDKYTFMPRNFKINKGLGI